MVAEIALGGLEKEDKELHQLDRAVFSKVPFLLLVLLLLLLLLLLLPPLLLLLRACFADLFLLASA